MLVSYLRQLLESRYIDTVVMYDGSPHYVHDVRTVGAEVGLYLRLLKEGGNNEVLGEINISTEDWENGIIQPWSPETGYYNSSRRYCANLTREVRHKSYKHSFSGNNYSVGYVPNFLGRLAKVRKLPPAKNFVVEQLQKGTYGAPFPKISVAANSLFTKGGASQAISRDYCLVRLPLAKELLVFHKSNSAVGVLDNQFRLELAQNAEFLAEDCINNGFTLK